MKAPPTVIAGGDGKSLGLDLARPADWIAARTGMSARWALAFALIALVASAGGAIWLFGQGVAEQLGTLWRRIPGLISGVRSQLAEFEWLIGEFDPRAWLSNPGGAVGRGLGAIVATFGVAANIAIVLFIALFFALRPQLYVHGFLTLVPPPRRERARQVLTEVGAILRSWMMGQLFLMTVIAVITGVGLWALGVPLALGLALLAGLLEFVPYLGPLLAAIPAVLVALAESPQLAGHVVLLYLAIQTVEGYVLQPLVQQRAVYLPPAVVLLAQLVLGVLVGALGIILATPVAATAFVAVRMLYVEDLLGEKTGA
jgi:predicted PurR-regulated permease PerM